MTVSHQIFEFKLPLTDIFAPQDENFKFEISLSQFQYELPILSQSYHDEALFFPM